jgi:hypothetical protein
VAQVQAVWGKFNANERLEGIGAVIIIVSWLVGSVLGYLAGLMTISLLGAIAALAVLYLKYAPNQSINWPAPIPVLMLGISAVVGLLALLNVISYLRFLGGIDALALIGVLAGAGILLWGAYQEWNATKTTA